MDALIPFTTSGSLVDCVDKKMMVVLRDGRKLIGVLRSYDQFANLVLENTIERIYSSNHFADSRIQQLILPSDAENPDGGERNVCVIRGENVVLLGEIDLDLEDEIPLRPAPWKAVEAANKAEKAQRKRVDEVKEKVLRSMGFTNEGQEGDAY